MAGLLWKVALSLFLVIMGTLFSADASYAQLSAEKNQPQPFPSNPFSHADQRWAAPIFIANFVLLATGLLHYLKLMPIRLRNAIRSAFAGDVSAGTALIVVSAFLALYISIAAGEVAQEEDLGDYLQLKLDTQSWPYGEVGIFVNRVIFAIDYMLFWISLYVFGNIRLVPFLASMALAIMTYLFVSDIAKKRLAGLVAMAALMQSRIFLEFDTVVSYDNFWVLFFVVSLYLSTRTNWRGHLSPIAYYLGVSSKPLIAVYAPINMFFICRSDAPRRRKLLAVAPYALLTVGMVSLILSNELVAGTGFDAALLFGVMLNLPYLMATDPVFLVFIIPVTVGLFFKAWKGVRHADSVLFMIFFAVGSYYLLDAVTGIPSQPYRMIPLVTFFAFGAGMVFAKTDQSGKKESRIISTIIFALAMPLVIMIVIGILYPGDTMLLMNRLVREYG